MHASCMRDATAALPPPAALIRSLPPSPSLNREVCSLKCSLLDVPGSLAEEVAEVLLAYGAQSTAVEEYRPAGAAEQELFHDDAWAEGGGAGGRVWDRCTVVAYMPPDVSEKGGAWRGLLLSLLAAACCSLACPRCAACPSSQLARPAFPLSKQLDGGEVLASTAADFGLSQLQRLVEEVRTQDWEQSIRASCERGAALHGCAAAGVSVARSPCSPPRSRQPPSTSPRDDPFLRSQDSYQPAQVGEGLWIVPIWCEPPDAAATNIILEPGGLGGGGCCGWVLLLLPPCPASSSLPGLLNPSSPIITAGLAFGTGDHPTTRLCLRWLQGLQASGALQGASVMDYGAGSGVLAVAALLMGAARAVGTDVEPLAVKSTLANAALNGVGDRLASYLCAGESLCARQAGTHVTGTAWRLAAHHLQALRPLPPPPCLHSVQPTWSGKSRWRRRACPPSSGCSA